MRQQWNVGRKQKKYGAYPFVVADDLEFHKRGKKKFTGTSPAC